MPFSEEILLAALQPQDGARYCVALSGGRDSIVLLHAAAKLRDSGSLTGLRALHVHHGLHADADQWAEHCRQFCDQRAVPLKIVRETVTPSGAGLEADARTARYRVFAAQLQAGEILLQAHHADDQAETFLLRALRGAGVRGLAAIPCRRPLGAGWLERPLLDVHRGEITRWAEAEGLWWVEDPGNRASEQDRNFLRNEVLPLLRQRWPAATASLVQSAANCAEAEQLVRASADVAFADAVSPAGGLRIPALQRHAPPMQKEMLRSWVLAQGFELPDQQALRRILGEVVRARQDAAPCLHWGDAELRRFADTLYIAPPLPSAPTAVTWDGAEEVELGGAAGSLRIELGEGPGLQPDSLAVGGVKICFRAAGERCHPEGRAGSHPLKKLLQEHRVAPWLRDHLPLLARDGQILAAGGLFYAHGCCAEAGKPALRVTWAPAPAFAAPLEHAKFVNPPSVD